MMNIKINDKNGVPSTNFGIGLYLGIEEHHLRQFIMKKLIMNLINTLESHVGTQKEDLIKFFKK